MGRRSRSRSRSRSSSYSDSLSLEDEADRQEPIPRNFGSLRTPIQPLLSALNPNCDGPGRTQTHTDDGPTVPLQYPFGQLRTAPDSFGWETESDCVWNVRDLREVYISIVLPRGRGAGGAQGSGVCVPQPWEICEALSGAIWHYLTICYYLKLFYLVTT